MRHNMIRDLEANILKDVCKDVRIEPELLPIGDTSTSSTNVALKARLDVSAVGVWSPMERTFLDVRVVHPLSDEQREDDREDLREERERKEEQL